MEDVETDASSLKAVLSWHLNDSVQRVGWSAWRASGDARDACF